MEELEGYGLLLLWDISPLDAREVIDWVVKMEIETGHDIDYQWILDMEL